MMRGPLGLDEKKPQTKEEVYRNMAICLIAMAVLVLLPIYMLVLGV